MARQACSESTHWTTCAKIVPVKPNSAVHNDLTGIGCRHSR